VPALPLALAALGALAAVRLDPGHAVTALLAFAVVALALSCGWEIAAGLPERLGWWIARHFLARLPEPSPWPAWMCPGVAMPTGHSLTRTYSRPVRLLWRYQVSDRCWHCDWTRPYPAEGWRARRPSPRPGWEPLPLGQQPR
jgi:hypothetical protein